MSFHSFEALLFGSMRTVMAGNTHNVTVKINSVDSWYTQESLQRHHRNDRDRANQERRTYRFQRRKVSQSMEAISKLLLRRHNSSFYLLSFCRKFKVPLDFLFLRKLLFCPSFSPSRMLFVLLFFAVFPCQNECIAYLFFC